MKDSIAKKFLEIGVNKKDKVKTSLKISKGPYTQFKKICKERGLSPSDILDYLIIDFNKMARDMEQVK